MSDTSQPPVAIPAGSTPKAVRRTLGFEDLRAAPLAGMSDYKYAPGFGLPFVGVYALGGLFLLFLSDRFVWQTIILALGFPQFAPFAAIALYELSCRMRRVSHWIGARFMA